jgi:hypothetical protein
MAIIIDMSKEHGLQVERPNQCALDVERGLLAEIKPGQVIKVSP